MASIGEQGIDWPARCSGPELIYTLCAREVGLDNRGFRAKAEAFGSRLNLGTIGRHQQVEALLSANRRELQADSRRCPGDDREGFAHFAASSSNSIGIART